jgi:hypothetical protein
VRYYLFARIFSNYNQNNSYPNQVQNIISNFNQGGYYTNYPYDSSICSHLYPAVYQQSNSTVPPCHTYIILGDSSSTYDPSNFQDNYGNLAYDSNLNIFDINLSLDRAEKQSNIDPTIIELSDDQDEQDDTGPHDWSEIEIEEDYIEQSDVSNDESDNEEIQRCNTTLLVIG